MQIEEAIEIMNNFLKDTPKAPFECLMNKEVEAVETLLNELEKKDKVIDEMTEIISNVTVPQEKCKKCIKEYFYKKVSDNK